MGKWSGHKKEMPKFEQPSDFQAKVNELKEQIKKNCSTVKELASCFEGYRKEKDEANEKLKDINTALEAVQQLMLDRLEDDDVTSFKREDGTTFFVKDDPYSSVEDKQTFFEYLKKEGLEALFSVPYQTVSSLVRERLEAGETLPPGVAVYMKSSIQMRRTK